MAERFAVNEEVTGSKPVSPAKPFDPQEVMDQIIAFSLAQVEHKALVYEISWNEAFDQWKDEFISNARGGMNAELKEKIARAISGMPFSSKSSLRKADAVLSAMEAAGYVVVPREALSFVMEHGDFTDCGPPGYGWRSDKMENATAAIEAAMKG